MKIALFIMIIICNLSCSKKYGYIYDKENLKPLEGVLVVNINNSSQKFITNKDGLFSFKNSGDLIIKKEGYETDTLREYGCKPSGKCFDGHIFYMKRYK